MKRQKRKYSASVLASVEKVTRISIPRAMDCGSCGASRATTGADSTARSKLISRVIPGLSEKLYNARVSLDRKSTRLNSSHTEIYTLSLHDALPIWGQPRDHRR